MMAFNNEQMKAYISGVYPLSQTMVGMRRLGKAGITSNSRWMDDHQTTRNSGDATLF